MRTCLVSSKNEIRVRSELLDSDFVVGDRLDAVRLERIGLCVVVTQPSFDLIVSVMPGLRSTWAVPPLIF
ncbi:hypothetical protein SAMN05216285_2394 [Natrinema salifodinae]|uniref:Uncharacterized protein n=1 Tax=Natrinema salifodinae TaxID=1202768 RepID=A0A1I0PBZ5_9EURY|nr:hypothetical protein SAMN05216285_2394 [Natrinema salifodinae]